jgi:secreted trypsin-like serine protease
MSNAGIHLTIAFLWLFPVVQVSARTDVSLVHEVVNVHKTTRIVGGDLAEDDRYPYVVSVQMEGAHFCGGTLIAKDIVLTAAHCLSSGSMLQVIVDRIDMTKSDEGDQVAVNMMIAHPEFDVSGTWEYDFALLILARSITTSNVQLMELNIDDHFPPSGTIGTVMGWGDTKQHSNEQNVSDILMTVEAETISNEECASAQGSLDGFNGSYEDWIFSSMICTLSNNQNACKGDSGQYTYVHERVDFKTTVESQFHCFLIL